MRHIEWLSHLVNDYAANWPFSRPLHMQWLDCTVDDNVDALGCVLMGGEL